MDMLEIHTMAMDSDNTAYHEFLLCYELHSKVVYGFVEGKDDPSFYYGIIENHLPDGWDVKLIKSGTKRKVLKTLKSMDWSRFPQKQICFFVDRDLSVFLPEENIENENLYITDNYAIENEIATFQTMKRVLEEICNITELSISELQSLEILFESNLKFFCSEMAPIMTQIIIWRKKGQKPELDRINPKVFFDFIEGCISLKSEFAQVDSRIEHIANSVNILKSGAVEIRQMESLFRSNQGVEKFVRGKYVLWFFIECALSFHGMTPKICVKHSKPPKMRMPLGPANALVLVAPRVRCPKSLKKFIAQNYLDYIRATGSIP